MKQNLDWGSGLSLYDKTRKAILEVLREGAAWKHDFYHEFWKRGFQTTSSALSKHLTKLCVEKKIQRLVPGLTIMVGDDSLYALANIRCKDDCWRDRFSARWYIPWCPHSRSMGWSDVERTGNLLKYTDYRCLGWLRICEKTGKVVVHNKKCDVPKVIELFTRRRG